MEKIVWMSAKMYQCRKSARFLFAENFDAKMKEYGDILKAVSERENIGIIEALIKVNKSNANFNGVTQMTFIAAAVELIEKEEGEKHENPHEETNRPEDRSGSG